MEDVRFVYTKQLNIIIRFSCLPFTFTHLEVVIFIDYKGVKNNSTFKDLAGRVTKKIDTFS